MFTPHSASGHVQSPGFASRDFLRFAARAWPASSRRRRDLAFQRLAGVSGLGPHNPEAGMFMMVDVRGTGMSAVDFAWRLLEAKGVSVLPTDPFGPSAAGHVRISIAIGEAKLAEACERIADFVEEEGTA